MQKPPRRQANPVETAYRHLLKNPPHDLPPEVEPIIAISDFQAYQGCAEVMVFSLEDVMEMEIELISG